VHVLLAVRSAAQLGASNAVRFAALTHDLGKARTPRERWPSHHGHEAAGVPLIEALCARLKVPNAYRELAVLAARHHTLVHRAAELKPATVLTLLEDCDAFRRSERFAELLLACEADARGRAGREGEPYPQAGYLRAALEAAAAVTLSDDERVPVLAGAAATHLEELVAGGGEHGRDPDEERKLGRRGTQRETCEHGREDGAPGAGGAGKDRRQDLAQSYPERDVPGHRGARGFARDVTLDDEDQDPADEGRQRHGYHGLRQLPSEAGREKSPRRRDQEGHGELRQVVAVGGLLEARQEIQQAAPVNEHDRENRARLDRHVEQLRALPQ